MWWDASEEKGERPGGREDQGGKLRRCTRDRNSPQKKRNERARSGEVKLAQLGLQTTDHGNIPMSSPREKERIALPEGGGEYDNWQIRKE